MSCSDNINPSTINFVAYGTNNSDIGSYNDIVEITLPPNASRSILELSLYNQTLNTYDYNSFNIPLEDDCVCIPNCIVKTKIYNTKLYYSFNFSSLIKGHEYTLNLCLKYNKDPELVIVT